MQNRNGTARGAIFYCSFQMFEIFCQSKWTLKHRETIAKELTSTLNLIVNPKIIKKYVKEIRLHPSVLIHLHMCSEKHIIQPCVFWLNWCKITLPLFKFMPSIKQTEIQDTRIVIEEYRNIPIQGLKLELPYKLHSSTSSKMLDIPRIKHQKNISFQQ